MKEAKAIGCASREQAETWAAVLTKAGYDHVRVVGEVDNVEALSGNNARWLVVASHVVFKTPVIESE